MDRERVAARRVEEKSGALASAPRVGILSPREADTVKDAIRYRAWNLWLRCLDWKRPDGAFLARGSRINRHFRIGTGSRVNGPVLVVGGENCEIGRYCAIAEGLRLITSNHDMNHLSVQLGLQREITGKVFVADKKGVKIGSDVWIGDSVLILAGVEVGHGAVIGAGSVVTRSIPPYTVWAGVPARQIRRRFSEEMTAWLLDLRWWEWSKEEMKARSALFEQDLTTLTAEEARRR